MISAEMVAKYFLQKDPQRLLFNKKLVEKNNRSSYEGNVKLNKFLFLSQVVFMAKYGRKLFNDNFVAYDNGPVIKSIIHDYQILTSKNDTIELPELEKNFLDKMYESLKDVSCDELVEITHEDPEWRKLSNETYSAPVMDIDKYFDLYRDRYKGFIKYIGL